MSVAEGPRADSSALHHLIQHRARIGVNRRPKSDRGPRTPLRPSQTSLSKPRRDHFDARLRVGKDLLAHPILEAFIKHGAADDPGLAADDDPLMPSSLITLPIAMARYLTTRSTAGAAAAVTLPGAGKDLMRSQHPSRLLRPMELAHITDQRGVAGHRFETSPQPAVAEDSVGHDHHVAQVSRADEIAFHQGAVDDDARADPNAHGDEEKGRISLQRPHLSPREPTRASLSTQTGTSQRCSKALEPERHATQKSEGAPKCPRPESTKPGIASPRPEQPIGLDVRRQLGVDGVECSQCTL